PSEQDGVGVAAFPDLIPTDPLVVDLDPDLADHVDRSHGQALTHTVLARVEEFELGPDTVFLTDSVGALLPSGLVEELLCLSGLRIVEDGVALEPGQAVDGPERGRTVALENRIDQRLAVEGDVDGLTGVVVGGRVVAHRI